MSLVQDGAGKDILSHLLGVDVFVLLGPTLLAAVLVAATFFFVFGDSPRKSEASSPASSSASPQAVRNPERNGNFASHCEDILREHGAPDYPHEQGVYVPSEGYPIIGNKCTRYENDFAVGKFQSFHRTTYSSKDYDTNDSVDRYFKGKKRLWESRVQFTPKQTVKADDLQFGVMLEEYVPMNMVTKQTMGGLVKAMKSVVGPNVYHSVGDDPNRVEGLREKPIFAMPVYAFDQYIVSLPHEKAPDLEDHETITSSGSKRSGRVADYKEEMKNLVLEPGTTYTLCFWGISQWLDKLNWKVKLPVGGSLDFNKFAGTPPVHVVIYKLKSIPGEEHETRHLSTRLDFFFHIAFWTSKKQPSWEKISSMMTNKPEVASAPAPKKKKGFSQWLLASLACCTYRTPSVNTSA